MDMVLFLSYLECQSSIYIYIYIYILRVYVAMICVMIYVYIAMYICYMHMYMYIFCQFYIWHSWEWWRITPSVSWVVEVLLGLSTLAMYC